MAVILATSLVATVPAVSHADETPFYLHNGDRVVIYGDSITAQQLYSVDTQAFVETRYPKLNVSWVNSGWGGDRVSGGSGGDIDLRIERDIIPFRPTVMTCMLGMNDGAYRSFDQSIFDTYSKGYQYILNKVGKEDPGVRLTLIEPSPWDDITVPRGGYNDTLARYSDEVLRIGHSIGATVVDFQHPMNDMLTRAKSIDPTNAPNIIPGRVHPSPGGHVFMASQLVKGWGMGALVSNVGIDAASGKVIHADNASVSNLSSNGTVSWTEIEGSLPLPLDFTDPVANLVLKSSDIVATLDQETLAVSNLSAASYDLKIDNADLGQFTKEQLAQGINLATMQTPMLAQSLNVLQIAHDQTALRVMAWRNTGTTLEYSDIPDWHIGINYAVDDPSLIKAIDKAAADINKGAKQAEANAHAKSIPAPHKFVLTPLQP